MATAGRCTRTWLAFKGVSRHSVCQSSLRGLPVRLAETWLKVAKNTVLAKMLREKNTIPAEKKETEQVGYKVSRTWLYLD